MMDIKVYTKKTIKSDYLWEEKPHIAFLLYLAVYLVIFFAGIEIFVLLNISEIVLTLYLLGITALLVWTVELRNNMCNISKSIAFIKKDGILYQLKLGYLVDYQVFARNDIERKSAIAGQVQAKEIQVRNLRDKPQYFVAALDVIHETGRMPECVIEYLKMESPKIEKETPNFIWISYDYKGERKIKKYRNAYDLDI